MVNTDLKPCPFCGGTKKTIEDNCVSVVRCKACKYYKPDEYECGCDFAGGLPYVKENDFCSYGKRKDGDDNAAD